MATPLYNNPCPERHENYNFSKPFLGHHYFIQVTLDGSNSDLSKF